MNKFYHGSLAPDIQVFRPFSHFGSRLAATQAIFKKQEKGGCEGEIEKMFSDKCLDQTTDKWADIHLKSCMAISEDDLSVRQAKMFLQWRLEHMSFKSDDEQPGPMNLQG